MLVKESQFENCASPGQRIHRILKEDLRYRSYKKRVQPFLIDAHRADRKTWANWIRTSFRKEQIMTILSSDEKNFDIDGV